MPSAPPASPSRDPMERPGLFLAMAATSAAATYEVDFSCLLPEADRVYLVGSFNDWTVSDDSLMTNDNGRWRKTVPLETGEYAYQFKAEGERISGDGWRLDWKAPRETRRAQGVIDSVLVVPDDLGTFRPRQRRALETPHGIEIPIFYDRYPSNSASFRPGGYSNFRWKPPRPAGDWNLPVLEGVQPLFAMVPLGDSNILAILDRHPADARFYNRMYFDRNANRDLTDDPPIDGDLQTPGRRYFFCMFPPIDLEIEVGGHRMPYSLSIEAGGKPPRKNAASGYDRR